MGTELVPENEDASIGELNDDEFYENDTIGHRLVDYINTKRGDIMLGRLMTVLEQMGPGIKSIIESKAEVQRNNPSVEYKKWLWLLIVRFLVVTAALGATLYLKSTGNLDSTTSIIVVTVATVFFSFGRKESQ